MKYLLSPSYIPQSKIGNMRTSDVSDMMFCLKGIVVWLGNTYLTYHIEALLSLEVSAQIHKAFREGRYEWCIEKLEQDEESLKMVIEDI